MLFSVVVPSYNRYELLKINLKNILEQIKQIDVKAKKGELLVIDDGSTDSTHELLKEYSENYPDIFRYKLNPENIGIAKTRNLLVNEAKGKYIIFIDSDVFPCDNLISKHLEVLENNENIICQGNLILTYDYKKLDKKFNPLTDYSRAFFDTAHVSIERKKIIQVGGFDENFSGYGWEDLELGIRLKNIGMKIYRNKEIYAYHYQPKISLDMIESYINKERARAKGAIYFYKKHPIMDVKLMTQMTSFNINLNIFLNKLLGFENGRFLKYLKKLEIANYDRFIPLFRLYINYFNIIEIIKLK